MPVYIGLGASLVLGLVILYYLFAVFVRLMAEQNFFWSYVREGRTKAIMVNGKFKFCIMSFEGHAFKAQLPAPPSDEVDKWEVVRMTDPEIIEQDITAEDVRINYWPLLKNIRWIGLPPFSTVYEYRFSWTSLEEEVVDQDDLAKKFKYSDKPIDYIIVQDDVYVTRINEAECADNIPLNLVVQIGGRIVNPYKALFAVERWLESTINRIDSRMRSFVGEKNYDQMRVVADSRDEDENVDSALYTYFRHDIDFVEEHWGFKITFIRIIEIGAGSDLADEFIRATTKVYVATQQANADVQLGRGLAARDQSHFSAIAAIPGGVEMFKWQRIGESGLTTYVEGGNVQTSIPVGGQGPNPRPRPADAQPQPAAAPQT